MPDLLYSTVGRRKCVEYPSRYWQNRAYASHRAGASPIWARSRNFLTNLILADDIPINLLTILICAIGGVLGWLIIVVLHLLGVAFYTPAWQRTNFSGCRFDELW
jgi:hypothetical protein